MMRPGAVIGLAAVAVLAAGGCSRAASGTPTAAAGEVGRASLLNTTCRQYSAMKPSDRREVIAAIGTEGNQLVAANPDLWVGVAAALCNFVSPSAAVRDIVTGGVR
jgi:hypothetical protein